MRDIRAVSERARSLAQRSSGLSVHVSLHEAYVQSDLRNVKRVSLDFNKNEFHAKRSLTVTSISGAAASHAQHDANATLQKVHTCRPAGRGC